MFDVQDELAHAVAGTVGGRVDLAGRERSARLSAAGLKAYDLHLRGKACYLKNSKVGIADARTLAKQALELDPSNGVTMAFYAQYCHFAYILDWTSDLDQLLAVALDLAKQAATLDDRDSTVRWILGSVFTTMRNYEEARVHAEKAIDLNPNDTEAREHYGSFLTFIGEPERALEQLEFARRHNPFGMSWSPWVRGMAYFCARRYGEAIDAFNQIHEPNHEVLFYVAACHAHAGHLAEARAKLRDFLRIAARDMEHFPGQNSQEWMNYLHRACCYKHRRDFDHVVEGLRIAGLAI